MNCNEFVELVTAYLDGSLDTETRSRVDTHLTGCDGCTNYLQQMRATVQTLGSIDDDIDGGRLDPDLRRRLLDTFRNRE
ncbi:anti-sigma factor [Mycobacterium sp. PS03-16]|nr:anti-sigma factor [Mycobacterium sp. PS03-16]